MENFRRQLALLFIWAGIFVGAVSQSDDRFPLRGQIVDQTGASVAAKVTLTGEGRNGRSMASDKEGRFVFDRVAAGRYRLRVSAQGFADYEESVMISAAGTESLKIALKVAEVKGEIEVKAQRRGLSVESNENASAVVLRGGVIRRLPHDQEQLMQVLQRMGGALASSLQVSVNGVSGAKLPPVATIKEIRINSDPFAAAYHEPGSARVEIETKGGEEQVMGGLFFNYRNSALDARNAFSFDKPPLDHRNYGGYWSSRLFNSRSFIFGSFEQRRRNESNIISAYLADGLYADYAPSSSRSSFVNLRADFLPSDRHTISLFYDLDRGREDGLGISSFDLPERAYGSRSAGHSLQASVRSIFSPKSVNEALIKVSRERVMSEMDSYESAIEVAGAFNSGGAQCCPERSVNHQLSFADNLSISAGRHFFKMGFAAAGAHVNSYSEQNFGGTFLFSGLSFFRLNRPILFTINTGDPQLKFNMWNFAVYAQGDIKLRENFTLSPGVRYETQTRLNDRNNVAPRLGFAWSPFKSQRTVVRGGAGLFYQQLAESQLAESLRYDGVRQRQLIIHRPRFPDPYGSRPMTDFPVSVSRLAPGLRTPYQLHAALGVERSLPRDTTVTVTYTFERGVRLFRSRDINAPLLSGFRPRPEFGRIAQLESSSSSTSHRLAVGFWQSLNPSVTLFASYALGRTIDNADGPDALPADNYNPGAERGFAAEDIRHQVFASALLTLPLKIELTPTIYFNTGRPYNITTGLDDNNDMVVNDRPAGVRRNAGRGPNFTSFDLRLGRQFSFGRGPGGADELPFNLEFAVEAVNLFNHVNFADFNGVQTSPFFGRANAAFDPRHITILVNFNFH